MKQDLNTRKPRVGCKGKLKTSKIERGLSREAKSESDDQIAAAADHQIITKNWCVICNVGFRNGKAFGGHMTHHSKKDKKRKKDEDNEDDDEDYFDGVYKQLPRKTTSRSRKTQQQDSAPPPPSVFEEKRSNDKAGAAYSIRDDGTPICNLCNKGFAGMMQVFGHLRSHSGYQPSVVTTKKDSSLPSSCSITTWRGLNSSSFSSVSEENEDERMQDAVLDLMSLANMSVSPKLEVTNSNSVDQEPTAKKRDLPVRNADKAIGKAILENGFNYYWEDDDEDVLNNDDDNEQLISSKQFCSGGKKKAVVNNNKRKNKKTKLVMDLEPSDDPIQPPSPTIASLDADKYKCMTCKKCFPSHRALGGHRSSHSKIRIPTQTPTLTPTPIPFPTNPSSVDDQNAGSGEINQTASVHSCKICDMSFPSGQALGGHQRRHWAGPVVPVEAQTQQQQQQPSSQITSAGEASQNGATGVRAVFDFDLNDLPPMEEDGLAAASGYGFSNGNGYRYDDSQCYGPESYGGGYGYASSSYNSNNGIVVSQLG